MLKILITIASLLFFCKFGFAQAIFGISTTPPFVVNLQDSFATTVAKMSQVQNFNFGSAASTGTPITNATQLAAYFSPYQDLVGTAKGNSEFESYVGFSNTGNFVFNSNNLALTATLNSGSANPVQSNQSSGTSYSNTADGSTANPIVHFGMSNTTGITSGMVLFIYNAGMYYVNTVVANTSISMTPVLGAPASFTTQNSLCVFFPYYIAPIGSSSSGASTTITLTVPSGVTTGMQVINVGGSSAAYFQGTPSTILTVSTVNSGNVVVSSPVTTFANTGSPGSYTNLALFYPLIQSGQIWLSSPNYYGPGFNGAQAIATSATFQMPTGFSKFNFGTITAGAPSGSWPAYWIYPGGTDTTAWVDTYHSEIDIAEFENSVFSDGTVWGERTHGNYVEETGLAQIIYGDLSSEWPGGAPTISGSYQANSLGTGLNTIAGQYANVFGVDLTAASHTFGLIWTQDSVYRYLDGRLSSRISFKWGAQRPPQIGLDLAVGSFAPAIGANAMFFPGSSSQFPMAFKISNLSVWTK